MKLWILSSSLTVSLLILSGCSSTPTPSSKENAVIDSSLPSVELTQHGVIVGMKSVAFEWKSIKDPKVKGIYIYKKAPSGKSVSELEYFKTIKNRYKTHFVDTDVMPDENYTYAFQTFSEDAQARRGKEIHVQTLPVLDSVSWIHSITGMPRTAKIIWRPHSNQKVKAYIIERKTLEDEKWEQLETLYGRLNAEYIDEDLKDNYVYKYRLRVLTYDGITSKPSNVVKVVTKATPTSVKNIKASTALPHKISLTWSASKEKDFAQYYLYRSENIKGPYELIAKLYNNKFVDAIQENGKSYFYRVSSVDKDGLESESERNSIQGMTLVPPAPPAILGANLKGSTIKVSWKNNSIRATSYIVSQKQKKGWFDESVVEYEDIKGNSFTYDNVEPNSVYSYVVYAIDKNGIKSDASVEVKVVSPESTELIEAPKAEDIKARRASKPVEVEAKDIIAPTEDLDLSGL